MKKMASSSHYTIPIFVFFLGGGPIVIWGKKKHLFFPVPLGGKMNIPGLGLGTWLVAGGKKTG